jgi:large subunit ribosomal protein L24
MPTKTHTPKKLKIKKGDTVAVIAGKDSGKRGTVQQVLPAEGRVVVEKVNMVKRHTKPRPAPRSSGSQGGVIPGGVIEREAPLHISNVQVVCPACGEPSRIGFRVNDEGNKVRVCRSCGKDLDR